MKRMVQVTVSLTVAVLCLASAATADSPTTKATVITSLTSMPLAFTENQGQWPDSVLFQTNAGGATMWFTENGAYYQFTRRIANERGRPTSGGSTSAPSSIDVAQEEVRRAQNM
jgi:hypothetical protein